MQSYLKVGIMHLVQTLATFPPSLPPGSIAEEPPCVSTIYDYFNHKLIWASCQGF